jgi:hypothetical protein
MALAAGVAGPGAGPRLTRRECLGRRAGARRGAPAGGGRPGRVHRGRPDRHDQDRPARGHWAPPGRRDRSGARCGARRVGKAPRSPAVGTRTKARTGTRTETTRAETGDEAPVRAPPGHQGSPELCAVRVNRTAQRVLQTPARPPTLAYTASATSRWGSAVARGPPDQRLPAPPRCGEATKLTRSAARSGHLLWICLPLWLRTVKAPLPRCRVASDR